MPNWIISPEKYLSIDEVRVLQRTCRNAAILAQTKGIQTPVRDSLIIELALGTGLRVSELSKLKVSDLFLKKGQNALLVKNGKGGKDRLVRFPPSIKSTIIDYLEYRASSTEFLFPSERGAKMTASGIQQMFKKWASQAGLPNHYSIHSLRHTHAVRLYKASGYNLRFAQK